MLFTLVQFQRGLMYQPDPTPVAEPSAAGLPWEVCTYSAADGVPVQSWLFKCATGKLQFSVWRRTNNKKVLFVSTVTCAFVYCKEGQQQSKPLINRIPTIVYFHGVRTLLLLLVLCTPCRFTSSIPRIPAISVTASIL